ncbi:MAG: rRNA maturation RNase YbeY [Candidatus Limnocylindrales bacterium]
MTSPRATTPGLTVRYLPPWRIECSVRPGVPRLRPLAELARLIDVALRAAGAPSPASIGLILSDDAELTTLNARAMGKDGPTDVLSFPLLPPERFPQHEGQAGIARPPGVEARSRGLSAAGAPPEFVLPPGARPHLGDIVVSVERAAAQASEGRGGQTGDVAWSPADELALLVVHGVLHLCGWDHADPAEERAMRRLEASILAGPGWRR